MKKRIFSLLLVFVLCLGAIAWVGCENHNEQNDNGAYNDAIRTKFDQVDEKLEERLRDNTKFNTTIGSAEVSMIKFLEPNNESVDLQVYYNYYHHNSMGKTEYSCYAIFNVSIDNYNAFVSVEQSNNMFEYLDALNSIFEEMTFVECYEKQPLSCDMFYFTEKNEANIKKFNEIFGALDGEDNDVIRQVGFLPYHISMLEYHFDEETGRHDYTFKISGISYCETKSKNTIAISKNDNLILESNYNKKNIKAYQRDIIYTSSLVNPHGMGEFRVSGDFSLMTKGENSPYTIETTLFEEVGLFNAYEKMQNGLFSFTKPKDLNLNDYLDK